MHLPSEALRAEIHALSADVRSMLHDHSFNEERFLSLVDAAHHGAGLSDEELRAQNRVVGPVRAPDPSELASLTAWTSDERERYRARGEKALRSGELAFCVMAGGMATRMGGVVKALVDVAFGKTFLDLRLEENRTLSERASRPVPLWLMTSDATDEPIRAALRASAAAPHVETFRQNIGVRVTREGRLFRHPDGSVSTYATGHGDLPEALQRSKILDRFVQEGGKTVWITNLDNLGATVDDAILGYFLECEKEVLVEVCDKAKGDRGGIPVHAQGRLQVLEEFRLPIDFDASSVRVFNTNTFIVRAEALAQFRQPSLFFRVEKSVDGKPAIQFERLLQELTAHLPTAYLRVPRDGAESRFVPVKDNAELAARRALIEEIAKLRGMIPKK